MKAIGLWQPWASLWLSPRKRHETRDWATSYRGQLAVHACKRFEKDVDDGLRAILEDEFGFYWAMDLPVGAIIGVVDLVSCIQMGITHPADDDDRKCGNWSNERYAWARDNDYTVFETPIQFIGRQGLFNVPDEIIKGAS